MKNFNGLNMSLGSLPRLSPAKTRSLSAENFSGAKGEGGKATEGIRILSNSMQQQIDDWYGVCRSSETWYLVSHPKFFSVKHNKSAKGSYSNTNH